MTMSEYEADFSLFVPRGTDMFIYMKSWRADVIIALRLTLHDLK